MLVEKALCRKRAAESEAGKQRDDSLRFDEVWCVFDVDEHPGISDARQKAAANGIKLVVSNPCFELWPLLHFQDQTAHIHRSKVQSLCRKYMPGCEKKLPCEELLSRYEDAYARATDLARLHTYNGTEGANPSTDVYKLVQAIRLQRTAWPGTQH